MQWNLKLTEALIASGFNQSVHDYSFFTKTVGAHIVLILIYVDDLIITDSFSFRTEEAKSLLRPHFKINDQGHEGDTNDELLADPRSCQKSGIFYAGWETPKFSTPLGEASRVVDALAREGSKTNQDNTLFFLEVPPVFILEKLEVDKGRTLFVRR
ncbi:uncharacterized protein LOC114076433 [Solanum pennellii]|uniref:Uncharacterized protein LOC114076433 n=1 Tax=Solanum pennellii TaxID=28526 RepID=A0ABM1V686_SOLPN|nr:uncharacterized protein LOC114076433 [Solanum pennellii]